MSCKPQLLDSHCVSASYRTELARVEDSRYLERLSVEFMYNSLGLTYFSFALRLAPAVLGEVPSARTCFDDPALLDVCAASSAQTRIVLVPQVSAVEKAP